MDDGNILTLVPHKSESAVKDSEGRSITLTYATKDNLADGSVTKVGVNTVGGANRPIYLLNGVPTVCDKVVNTDGNQTITGMKAFEGMIRSNRPSMTFDANAPQQWAANIQMLAGADNYRVGTIEIYSDKGNTHTYLWSSNPVSKNSGSVGVYLSRDGNTNYISGFNPTPNAPSHAIVTKGYVESTDGVTNNLVHKTGNELLKGIKQMESPRLGGYFHGQFNAGSVGVGYIRVCRFSGYRQRILMLAGTSSNNGLGFKQYSLQVLDNMLVCTS